MAEVTDDSVSEFIKGHQDESIDIQLVRGQEEVAVNLIPREGIVDGYKVVGLSFDMIGTLKLPLLTAFTEGFVVTIDLTKTIAAK